MEFSIKIQFIDLCLNMIIRDDSIILVLFILGYLDPILDLEKCLIAKNEFYRLLGSEFSEEYKTQDELLLINQKRIEAFIRKEEMFDIITSISSRSEKELLSDSLVFVCLDIVMNDYGTFLMA